MTRGGKIALGVMAAAGVVGLVLVSGEKKASASTPPKVNPPLQPPLPGNLPIPPSGGVVMVPDDGDDHPQPGFPPIIAPPSGGPIVLPGGATFDPTTGQGTLPNGQPVQLPPLGGLPSTSQQPAGGAPTGPAQPLPGVIPTAPLPSIPGLPPLPPSTANLPGTAINLPPMVVTGGNDPQQVTSAPADTIATVTAMLAQEAGPKWRKSPEPTLVTWQKNRKLTADGKFGTGTALALAKEIGTLPIIRAWPKGSFPEGHWLEDYRTNLRQIAQAAPEPRKSQLMAAANREQGQGWGTPEKPILSQIHLAEA